MGAGLTLHCAGLCNSKLFAGYGVTPNLALEAGCADLGHTAHADGMATGHAGYVDVVGLAPVGGDVSLLGSLGVAHTKFETTDGDASGNGLKLGRGADVALAKNLALRLEVERCQPKVFANKPDLDAFSLGMQFAF